MALREILRDRAARKGGTAQVDCGELGYLTVEALSPSDCAALSDSRALLYAACRELQLTGEELRSEGKIFRPDEIVAYVTDEEADAAARTILKLSGLAGDGTPMAEMSEIRLQPVQGGSDEIQEIRHQSVQGSDGLPAGDGGLWTGEKEIRHEPVQGFGGALTEHGQVSHEFLPLGGNFWENPVTDNKSQILGDSSVRTAQILGAKTGGESPAGFHRTAAKSDLHEIKSEFGESETGILHEIESEIRRGRLMNLHETTSDFGGRRGILLHETESEYEWILHEIKSELKHAMHEIESEVREMLHESESELAEQAAQRLAEALKQAAQVR